MMSETRHPISRVAGVRIPAVPIIGHKGHGDEIVAAHDVSGQVRMRPVAGIDDGYRYVTRPRRDIPGGRQVDAAG